MKKRIGELLVESGACSDNDVREALGHQRAWASNQKLGEVLVSVGKVTPTSVARALSLQFDLPFIKLPQIPEKVSRSVPIDYQEQHKIVPFRIEVEGKSERLHIAVADPSNLDIVDELRFELRKTVRIYVAATDDIAQAISTMKGESLEEIQPIEMVDEDAPAEMEIQRGVESTPQSWFGGAKKEAPAAGAPPAADIPEEWSLGPSPAAEEKKAPAPPPAATPAAASAPPESVSADLDDLFGDAKPAADDKPSAAPTDKLPTLNDELPPEPATEPNKKAAAPQEEAHPFSAVLEEEVEEESWGAMLPGGSGTSPSSTTKSAPPSVAAPPSAPAKAESTAPAVTLPPAKAASTPPPPEALKPSAAATTSAAVSPTSTAPPNGAVMDKSETSQTAAPATEAEEPKKAAPEKPEEKPAAVEAKPESDKFEFSEDELRILEDIERLADGEPAKKGSLKVQPQQMVASLIRLLIKKGVINELEFLDELSRK